jgi:hypothetical protein
LGALMGWEFFSPQGAVKHADGAPAVVMDRWHYVGAAGEPAFGASVTALGEANAPAFRKFPDGRVLMKGSFATPSGTASLFVLPVGYRPPNNYVRFVCLDQSGTHCYVYVQSDGTVTKYTSGLTSVCLDVIEFDTETVSAYPPAAPLTLSALFEAMLLVPPAVKDYGNAGTSGTVPATWTATHSDGSVVSHVITPTIDCYWPTYLQVLARVTDTAWYRMETTLHLSPADVDGKADARGSVMHHSGASDWNSGYCRFAWKLAKNTTYTLTMVLAPVVGTWNFYRGTTYTFLGHDGIRPR